MVKRVEDIKEVAVLLKDALYSDRDAVIAVGGMTGEGKSVCMIQLSKHFETLMKRKFTFDCMTWDREELLEWIDGAKDGKKNKYGGRKPEYEVSIADELISMFYKRNWYEDDQKGAIELFNKCRDRHQLVLGAVPNFWDLDSGMLTRFRFYIYIPYRGVAWVFQQENNPFASDQWNITENRKSFRKHKNPYRCPNFSFEFRYNDLEPSEKKAYYKVRNTKRKNTELQSKKKDVVKYSKIKGQRDECIRMAYETGAYTYKQISERAEIAVGLVSDVCNGVA